MEYSDEIVISPVCGMPNPGRKILSNISVMGPPGMKYIIEERLIFSRVKKCMVIRVLISLENMKKLTRTATSFQFDSPSENASSRDKCIPNSVKIISVETFVVSMIVSSRSEKTPL